MSSFTILCVDDERNVLLTLRSQLSRHFPEYAIEIAESATEALELVEELMAEGAEIPLVIADQIMPGLRGDEFLIELHHRHPRILQVMLTGQASAEEVGNVVNRGNLYRFISKPWDEADLCLTVREALRRYQQEHQLAQQQAELEQANQALEAINTDLEQQIQDRTQQLQAALEFNQQVITTAQEGIIVWDRDLKYCLWNRFMEDLSGLPAEAVLGQYCLDVFPFLQENGVFGLLQQALSGEMMCAPDSHFNVPETGRTGWSYECFVPLRDTEGNITGVLGTVHDVSDRKRAELEQQQLLKQLSDMKFALDQAAIVATTDAQGRITYVNDLFCNLSQYSRDELIGNTHQLINSGYHSQSFFQDLWRTISSGQVWKGEVKNRAKGGSEYWVDTVIVPFLDNRGRPFQYMAIRFDITDRKQAEMALRESEEQFRQLTNTIREVFYIYDLNPYQVRYISPGFEDIWGVAGHELEQNPALWLDSIHPADRDRILQAAAQQSQGQPFQEEYRIIRPDGEIRWINANSSPIADSNGQFYRIVGICEDITARKLAEIALRDSEEQNRAILSVVPDIMTVIDANGHYLSFASNQFSGELLPLEQMDPTGLCVTDVLPSKYASLCLATIQQTLSTGEIQCYEQQLQFADRSQYEEVRIVPYQSDKVLCMVRDISDRKQAEAALQESQQFIQQIADSSPNVIYIYDLAQQRNIYVNREVVTFLGYTHEEVMSRVDQSLATLMHPDDLELAMQHFQQLATLPDGEIADFEYRMRHKNGEWRWFFSRDTVFRRDAEGQVSQVLGNAQDITARKHAEEALRANEQKYHQILDSITDMVLVKGKDSEIVWANRAFRDYYGMSMAELQGLIDAPFNRPDYTQQYVRDDAFVFNTGQILNIPEEPITRHDGVVRTFSTIKTPLRDEQGQVMMTVGVSRDITEQRQIELEIRQSQQQLAAIAANVPGGVFRFIYHPDGSYSCPFVSEGYRTLLGISPEVFQVNPNANLDMVHPDDRPIYEAAAAAAIAGEVSDFYGEVRYILPSGETKWIATIAQLHRASNGDVIVDGIDIDISDRKRTEAALQESERLLSMALAAAKAGVWEWDITTNETYWSDENCRLIGYEPGSVESTYENWLRAVHPEDRKRVNAYVTKVLTERSDLDLEYRVLLPDGSVRWLSDIGRINFDAQQNPLNMSGIQVDITDRKLAELELRQREEQLEAIAANLPGYLYRLVVHPDGTMSLPYLSAGAEQVYGLPVATLTEDIAQMLNLVHPQDCQQIELALTSSVQTLSPYNVEFRVTNQKGGWSWFQGLSQVYRSEHGNTVLDGIALNIDARKRLELQREQSEAALRASEAQYRRIVETANEGIWMIDPDNRTSFVNSKMAEILGYTVEEMLGKSMFEFMDESGIAIARRNAKRRQEGITEQHDFKFCHKNGTAVWSLLSTNPIFDDREQYIGALAMITDITARKQAEEALRNSEEQFRQMAETISDIFWVMDLEQKRVLYISPAFERVWGRSSDFMYEQWGAGFAYIHPEDQENVASVSAQALETGGFEIEYRILRPDGTIRHLLDRGFVVPNEQGQLTRLVGVAQDITERKQTEIALRKVVEGTASSTDEEFFAHLVQHLVEALGVTHAIVTQYQDQFFHTLAFWSNGSFVPNITYSPQEATACALVIEHGEYLCANRVCQIHGDNPYLESLQAESYLGIALQNQTGQCIGHLCIIDNKPITHTERFHSILKIFAARAAAELERQRAKVALQNLNEELEQRVQQRTQDLARSERDLRTIFNNVYDAIYIHDLDGSILDINARTMELLGASREQILASDVADLSAPNAPIESLGNVFQQVQDGNIIRFEWKCKRLDNSAIFDAEVSLQQVTLGNRPVVIACVRDISDRKQAELALRDSEARFQAFMNNSPAVSWISDANGVLVYLSQTYCQTFQIPFTDAIGKSIFECYPPDIAQQFLANIQTVATTQQPLETIEQAPRPDGTLADYLVYKFPVPDASGQSLVGGVAFDITDRNRAEAALQQALATNQALLNAIPDLIMRISRDGVYQDVIPNDRVPMVAPLEQVVGRRLPDVLPSEVAQRRLVEIERAFQSGLPQTHEYEIDIDGNRFYFEGRCVVCGEDEAMVLVRDISDRKRAETQLQQQEQFLRSIFEGSENPIFVVDVLNTSNFRYVGWNSASEKMTGIQASDIIGKTPVEAMGLDQGTRFRANYRRCVEAGTAIQYEEELTLPSGSFWTLTTLNPLQDSTGKIYRIVGNALDITARKQVEAQLMRQEYLLRNMYEGVEQSICIIDVVTQPGTEQVEFYFDSWNRATERKTGILSKDIVGKTPIELLGETKGAAVRQNYQRCYDAGVGITYEEFLPFQDRDIWWLTTLNPLKDDEGNIYRIVITTFDISDRKHAELELQKLAAVVENSTELIGIASMSGESLYLNAAGQQLMGVTSDQLKEMPVSNFLSPEGLTRFEQEALPILIQQGYWQGESIFRNLQTGEDIVAEQTLFLIHDPQTGEPLCMATISRDIRDRKQAEANLIESETRLRHLLSTTSDWIWEVDTDGIYTYVNGQVKDILGYEPEEVLGKTPFDFMPPAEASRVLEGFMAIASEQQPFHHLENTNLRKDGQEIIIDTTGVPIFDADGKYLGYRGTCSNITARKQAEVQLREQEQFLRSIYEGSSQPIFVADITPDGTVRQRGWNPVAERLMGKSTEEVVGRLITEIFAPDNAEAILQRYAQCISTKQPFTFEECLNFQHETRWMLSTYNPLLNQEGRVYRIVGTVYDITELKRVEVELREAQQFAQSIADLTPAALYIYDLANQCNLYSNRSITAILGYSPEEVEAMGANLMPAIVHPDDFSSVIQHQEYIAAAADDEDVELEYRMIRADGSICWLYSIDSVFKRDESGRVIQYIGAAQEITDRKLAEHALQQLNLELEQRVSERTLALQQAMEVAEAANRSKSVFLANMSHELRTPLNAILGFAQIMSRDTTIDSEKREQLGIINRSGKHLLHLINDILEMSKIEAGRIQLSIISFDLYILLGTLEDMFQHRAVEKGLHFLIHRADDLPRYIQADENKLRQVLINLIGNAIKFTNSGRVELQVSQTSEVLKTSEVWEYELALQFEVIDTGIGIASDELESLFEPFTQSRNRQVFQEGTGLGLSISRQFVHLMGGELSVTSTPGLGSTFTIIIPAQLADANGLSPTTSPNPVLGLAPNQPTYRLLVAEDTLTNRLLMMQLLQSLGFEVQTANNGAEAIALWESWHPHLIWMDMRMPVMDGYEATRQIRQKESSIIRHSSSVQGKGQMTKDQGATIIIALTASAFEEDRARVLAAGCNDFVRKPFQEDELLEKMAEHLGVEYLYAEAEAETLSVKSSSSCEAIAALQTLPLPLLNRMRQATLELDNKQLVVLLDQVIPTQPALATLLLDKVDNFDFEHILNLLQEAMPKR